MGAAVLSGLDRATRRYKSTWSPTTDNREFTRFQKNTIDNSQLKIHKKNTHKVHRVPSTKVGLLCRFLFGIVKFSEIIVVPSKKTLLLDEVPPLYADAPIKGYFMNHVRC